MNQEKRTALQKSQKSSPLLLSGNFAARSDVHTEVENMSVQDDFMDDINAGRMVAASNPSIRMELWGNTCIVVRDLLAGASVDECMNEIDKLQAEANR